MEPNQEKKFICKFCNKKYPCGKSLGGHIRIHLNSSSSTAAADIAEAEDADIKSSGPAAAAAAAAAASAGGGQSGYGLRENPKKTKWFAIERNKNSLLSEKVCKECGKGFQSLKALCGHMACHSKNSYLEDHSGASEKLKELVEDSLSDSEISTPSKRRRSGRMRYKAIGANSSSLSFANGGGGSLSSASDMEQEQEELAMCLMMLSRDSGFKGCFGSVADSTDNNSSILENKKKNHVQCLYNGNEVLGVKKAKKREVKSVNENDGSEDSGSGYFMNGPRTVESDVSTDGFTKIGELKKSKVEFGPRFDGDFDDESGKRLSRFRRVKTELGKVLNEKGGFDRADRAKLKYDSSKRYKNGSYDADFDRSNAQKQGKSSLLGGNRTSNGKANVCNDSLNESCENSIDTDYVPVPMTNSGRMMKTSSGKKPIEQNLAGNAGKKMGSKKSKMHECPFCSKVFRSGQALGGHKRSHFVGSGEDSTVVIKQGAPEIPVPALIDLNLPPAPMEEEANGFVPW